MGESRRKGAADVGKPEGTVEDYFIQRAADYGCMCLKFTSPSTTGVPDRILIGHGKTVFVELKAPGEEPRPRQVVVIGEMRDHGAVVEVVDSKPGVDALLKKLFPRTRARRAAGRRPSGNPAGPSATILDLLEQG